MCSLINTVAGDGGSEANYRVVDTDYDNYAILYDCSPFPVIKKGQLVVVMVVREVMIIIKPFTLPESLWLLTRQQWPDKNLVQWAYR